MLSDSKFVDEIIDCFFLIIALMPISLISDTSVFSILPSLDDADEVESSAKMTSAWSQPFFFLIFLKFLLVNFYS